MGWASVALLFLKCCGVIVPVANAAAGIVVAVRWYQDIVVCSYISRPTNRALLGLVGTTPFQNLYEMANRCLA